MPGILTFVRWVLVLAVVAAGMVAIGQSWRDPDSVGTVGYTPHELGPVGPADRDMLYKVKQAGLWEMPVGEEAQRRGTSPKLREIAGKIAVEHHELDAKVHTAAGQLSVVLPTEPTPDQQDWMAEITAEPDGDAYDRTAVRLLRQAHGKVLPLLAQVRTGTRNQVIREFADESMTYVARHIAYLESTGLVSYAELPEPPPPTPGQQPVQAGYLETHALRTLVIAGVVVVVLLGVVVGMGREILRNRRR